MPISKTQFFDGVRSFRERATDTFEAAGKGLGKVSKALDPAVKVADRAGGYLAEQNREANAPYRSPQALREQVLTKSAPAVAAKAVGEPLGRAAGDLASVSGKVGEAVLGAPEKAGEAMQAVAGSDVVQEGAGSFLEQLAPAADVFAIMGSHLQGEAGRQFRQDRAEGPPLGRVEKVMDEEGVLPAIGEIGKLSVENFAKLAIGKMVYDMASRGLTMRGSPKVDPKGAEGYRKYVSNQIRGQAGATKRTYDGNKWAKAFDKMDLSDAGSYVEMEKRALKALKDAPKEVKDIVSNSTQVHAGSAGVMQGLPEGAVKDYVTKILKPIL